MKLLHIFPVTGAIYGHDLADQGLAHSFLIGYILNNANFEIEYKIISKEIYKTMLEYQPDIVAISSMTYNFHNATKIASKAKEIGAVVIIGAHHISFLPHQLTKDMDVGVIGEGEETYLELLKLYNQDKWDLNYLKDVRGIVFRTPDNNIHITIPRPLIKNLDSVGYPKREFAPLSPSTKKAIVTSRGCPYKCVFCSQTRFWQSTIRFHTPEYVIKEIENVYKFSKTEEIRIDDGIFLINKERLLKILELWEKHPLYGRIKFTGNARANLIDNEMASLAKRMGIHAVYLGIESNNPDSLAYLKGVNVTPADNQRAYDILKKHKIHMDTAYIIGAPRETEKQIMDTYRFIRKNKLLTGDVSHLVPLPGTPVWDDAIKRGLVSDAMDFSILGGQQICKDAVFLSEKLEREKVIELIKMFNKFWKRRHFYFRLKHWIRYIYKNPFMIPKKLLKTAKRLIINKNRIKEEY
ncbi:MAG: radical SAM protein [Candidatus Aminicenantes bacterium]|jgi:radical SAM superfamily enzyme YgiQ (UPF0313 family)